MLSFPDLDELDRILSELKACDASLVAVSKRKPIQDIQKVYEHGHHDFGENYVQEMLSKKAQLPADIKWHFIGHLQRNKVKDIILSTHLIHGIDSQRLLQEVNKQAVKKGGVQAVLLQVHIAAETTKFGFEPGEIIKLISQVEREPISGVKVRGLMGMASLTDDTAQIRNEFRRLSELFRQVRGAGILGDGFDTLSMGMTTDYRIALDEGSTMVRIGSAIFGER